MIVYGLNVVREAIKSKYQESIAEIIIDETKKSHEKITSILSEAKSLGIRYRIVARKVLENITKTEFHQGIACDIGKFHYIDEEEMIENTSTVLICDSIMDPNNLGAISRSALLFGFNWIVIPKDRNVDVTPTVVKVSAGAILHQNISKVVNITRFIDTLKSNDWFIIGLDAGGSEDLRKTLQKSQGKIGIVVGSEEKGMRKLVKETCSVICSIPTTGSLDSLNASDAATIAMYEHFYNKNFQKAI